MSGVTNSFTAVVGSSGGIVGSSSVKDLSGVVDFIGNVEESSCVTVCKGDIIESPEPIAVPTNSFSAFGGKGFDIRDNSGEAEREVAGEESLELMGIGGGGLRGGFEV